MPTYRNTNPYYISFAVKLKSYNLGPNEIIETDTLLDDIQGLKRINNSPFYNPLLERHIFTGNKDSIHEFEVQDKNIQIVRVIVSPGNVDLYINDILNTPPTRVDNKFVFDIRSYKRIEKIILVCIQKSEIEISMFKKGESYF